MSKTTLPALFVGHGSPMNAIEDNAFTRGWREMAASIPKPRAIVCVSAHWESRGTFASAAARPATIHDFYGFPRALFDVRYEPAGDPDLAQTIARMVTNTNVGVDPRHGLDHGAWSILRVMYPNADVPTLQLSIDTSQPGEYHYRIGRELGALRDDGVLIIGSGNIVHNLRLYTFSDPAPSDWALRADNTVREHILNGKHDQLMNWSSLGRDVALAVPTPEHYLPLLYVLGAQRENEPVHLFNDVVQSAISMTSVRVG